MVGMGFAGAQINVYAALGGSAASLGVAIFLEYRLRREPKWKLFMAGIALGFGLTCLLPLGIAGVICGIYGAPKF